MVLLDVNSKGSQDAMVPWQSFSCISDIKASGMTKVCLRLISLSIATTIDDDMILLPVIPQQHHDSYHQQ